MEFKYLSRISYLMSKTITPRFSPFEFFMSRLIDRNQRAEFIEEVEFFLLGLKTGISELFIASTYHFSFIIFSDIFISLFLSLDTMLPFFPITVILLIPLLFPRIEYIIFLMLFFESSFPDIKKFLTSASTDKRLIIFFNLSA